MSFVPTFKESEDYTCSRLFLVIKPISKNKFSQKGRDFEIYAWWNIKIVSS